MESNQEKSSKPGKDNSDSRMESAPEKSPKHDKDKSDAKNDSLAEGSDSRKGKRWNYGGNGDKWNGKWKPRHERNRNDNWREGRPKSFRPKGDKKPVNAEALSLEAFLSKEDKPIVYQLSPEKPATLIEDWFKKVSPAKVRRSDGVGWIVVLSETATEEDKKLLLEKNGDSLALKEEWEQLTEKDDCEINFQTIKELSEKHNDKGGKWLFHHMGDPVALESIWKRVVLELVYKKFPPGVIGIKISPINDMNIPGASSRGGERANDHVICILHRDMNNEEEIKQIEKVLRAIPIRNDMTYKPNIFSTIGIYRQNKFKLRPTIYTSNKEVKDGVEEFVVKNVVDQDWVYRKKQEVSANANEEEKANLIMFLKERIREMRLSLDDMSSKLNVEAKNNATKDDMEKNSGSKSEDDQLDKVGATATKPEDEKEVSPLVKLSKQENNA